jgi:heme-degrading monooxygenase HmoA
MAQKMAAEQPGFLGVESARQELGVTVFYWTDLESIKKWKANEAHLEAQKKGRDLWYKSDKTRIAKVERDYESIE